MASASYREPRPHARSAAARQEKTRGRRRISRKAPDPSHDAVRTGAESDGRLHTGTTTPEGHSGPSMGKGQLWPFAQSSPPGSHWGICGVVEDYSIAGIQLVTGCNRLGPRNRTFNRTRSSFPYGKNDQLFDNQPRRTRRPCPCRQLLPSLAGSGGGMPHRMRSRLDGAWTRARNIVVFPASFPTRIAPGWCEVRTPVLLWASLKTHPRPQRSSPCLIRPPSRCAACLRSFPPSGYPPL